MTTSLGPGGDAVYAVAVQPDGKIVAAGSVRAPATTALARYRDGKLDTSFHGTGKVTTSIGSGDAEALAVALQPDGKIVAAGYAFSGTKDDFALARYNPDGSPDTSSTGRAWS